MSIMRITLIVDHDNDMMSGPVNFAKPCNYNKTVCPTVKNGFVFWKLHMKQSDRCNLKSTSISEICSMHGIKQISIHCPLTKAIYHLGERSMIPTVACSKVENNITLDVYKTLEGIWISGHTQKGKNITEWISQYRQGKGADVITKSVPKVNGSHVLGLTGPQLSWLEASWAKKSSDERSYVEMQLCREYAKDWDLAWNIRNILPQAAAELWMKKEHTVSTIFSGFILSWPCKKVTLYRFLKNKNCSENWPIEYSDGVSIHKGYLEPVSYKITAKQGRSSCRISPGFLYTLNESHVVNLATRDFEPMPISYFATDAAPAFEDQIFYSPALYSVEELGGQSQLEEMINKHHDHLKQTIYALSSSYEIATDEKLDTLAPITKATSFFGHYLGEEIDKVVNTISFALTVIAVVIGTFYAMTFCVQCKILAPGGNRGIRRTGASMPLTRSTNRRNNAYF